VIIGLATALVPLIFDQGPNGMDRGEASGAQGSCRCPAKLTWVCRQRIKRHGCELAAYLGMRNTLPEKFPGKIWEWMWVEAGAY
jgi:hypothetical protein